MIDLYTWFTPNPRKVSVMLEEVGLAYNVIPLDPGGDGVFSSEFLNLNPNNKIPVIVDYEGPNGQPLTLFESGAILVYLAEKTGSPLLSQDPVQRAVTLQWLMWQMSGIGPMIGQYFHFQVAAPDKLPYAITRYETEMHRLFGVLDARLAREAYLAGSDFSIADIAVYPWYAQVPAALGVDLSKYGHANRWAIEIAARPAVERGMNNPPVPA